MWILNFLILSWLLTGIFKTIKSGNEQNQFDRTATTPLRGILAIMIVVHHFPIWYPNEFTNFDFATFWGGSVVSIFFLLSGYGLLRSFHIKGKSYLKGFLKKRLSRILIPAIIVLFVHVVVECFVTGRDWHSFLFLISHPISTLGHYWYLVVIIIFYALYWCSFKMWGDSWLSVILICCAALLYYYVVKDYLQLLGYWYNSINGFAIGAIIAKAELYLHSYNQNHKRIWRIFSFVIVFTICAYNFIGCYIHYLPAWGTVFFYLLPFMVYVCNSFVSLPQCRMLNFLGGISLEIYLVHKSVMDLIHPFITSALAFFISVILLSILFAWTLKKITCK